MAPELRDCRGPIRLGADLAENLGRIYRESESGEKTINEQICGDEFFISWSESQPVY
jgi:hypothetical protein